MELSEERFNQIHAYLRGEGSTEDRLAFEEEMNQDPALAQEVATQKRIQSGLKINQYKRQFENIHAQLKAEGSLPIVKPVEQSESKRQEERKEEVLPGTSAQPLWRYVAAAASILLVIGMGWYIVDRSEESNKILAQEEKPQTNQGPNSEPGTATPESKPRDTPAKRSTPTAPDLPVTEQLFAEVFNPEPGVSSPFANDNLGVSPGSVARWQADTATLHTGVRLLKSAQVLSALTQFEKAEKSNNQEIREHAQWYAALALLREDNVTLSRQRLEQIASNEKHLYREQANLLLSKLQK